MFIYRSIKCHVSVSAPPPPLPFINLKIYHRAFLYLYSPFITNLTEVMPYDVTLTVTEVDVTDANEGKENRKYHPLHLYYKGWYYWQMSTYVARNACQDIGTCIFF